VDEKNHTVVAFLLTSLKGVSDTIHVAERFRIEKGLITEIEAIFHRDGKPDGVTGWEGQKK
jgi:hypothetical protein